MKMILFMTLSGSIVILCVQLLSPLIKKFRLFYWEYFLLKVSIFYFLFPLPLIKILWIKLIAEKFGITRSSKEDIFFTSGKEGILLSRDRLYLNNISRIYLTIAVLLFILGCFLLLRQIIRYTKIKKILHIFNPEAEDYMLTDLLQKLSVKKDVKLLTDNVGGNAFSIGFFRPFIILPKKLSGQNKKYILTHELCHIKRNDLLTKFGAVLVLCFHWFNPAAYLLIRSSLQVFVPTMFKM